MKLLPEIPASAVEFFEKHPDLVMLVITGMCTFAVINAFELYASAAHWRAEIQRAASEALGG